MKGHRKHHNSLISGIAAIIGSAAFYLFFRKARKKHKAAKAEAQADGQAGPLSETGESTEEAFDPEEGISETEKDTEDISAGKDEEV